MVDSSDVSDGRVSRRRFIELSGLSGVAALAGCSSGGGDTTTEGSGGGGGDTTTEGGATTSMAETTSESGGTTSMGETTSESGGSETSMSETTNESSGGTSMSEGGTTGSTNSGNTETLTLGAAISQSGDLSHEGNLYLDSYKMTIKDVNDKGGVDVGGTTYNFELKTYDDQSDASKSRQLFQKLIEEDDVKYLLGPYSSGVTLAAQPVVAKNQLPMVEGGGSSSKIFTDSNKYVFGTLATAPHYTDSAMKLAKTFSDPKIKTVAVAYENEIFSKNAAKGARDTAKQNGWDVAVNSSFPTSTSDISSILNKVKNAEPEIFVVAGHYKHAVLAAKQMKQYSVNVPMTIATVGATTSDFIDSVGDRGNYFYGTSQWASSGDYDGFFYGSAPDYVKKFKKSHDYNPDYHNASGSADILVYLDAFKRADSTDPKGITENLRKTDITTFFGDVKFDSTGANAGKSIATYQWQNQNKKLIAPKKFANTEAKYPTPKWSKR